TVGPEWSNRTVSTTPDGSRKFLGQFSNNTVSLSLGSLPAHSTVMVDFDLLITNRWRGNLDPDLWSLSVAGGPTLVQTTFSNVSGANQAYPGNYTTGASNANGTGATSTASLGYANGASVYHLSYTFEHTASSLTFNFAGANLEGVATEGWGLDNLTVKVT